MWQPEVIAHQMHQRRIRASGDVIAQLRAPGLIRPSFKFYINMWNLQQLHLGRLAEVQQKYCKVKYIHIYFLKHLNSDEGCCSLFFKLSIFHLSKLQISKIVAKSYNFMLNIKLYTLQFWHVIWLAWWLVHGTSLWSMTLLVKYFCRKVMMKVKNMRRVNKCSFNRLNNITICQNQENY